MTKSVVVLYSGGPDSYISCRWVALQRGYDDIKLVYVDLEHRYNGQELLSILYTFPSTIIDPSVNLSSWEESSAYIYGRNALLCVVASRYLLANEAGDIILTVQEDEMSIPDRTPSFMAQMGEVITTLRGQPTRVFSPWVTQDKTEMVSWLLGYEKPENGLLYTTSCYYPKRERFMSLLGNRGVPCGDCPACFRRAIAFGLNGIFEKYRVNPMKSKTAVTYIQRAESGDFSEKRKDRILAATSELEERYE